jgi:ABC-2 type transport system ATP-binding protein
MIAAHRLTKTFGDFPAVDSVDFTVPRGAVVGFLGPNGAGKTTTIRMVAGLLAPTSGSVEVDGLDLRRHGLEVRRRLGYLPEAAPVYGEMRVGEFLRFRARLFGLRGRPRRTAVDTALRRAGLEGVARRPIHQLSRGFRQRVGLAAALVHDPPVLILDEPTVGLDPAQILQVRALVRELAGTHTILLSTHILPEVEVTCQRLIMIARGRIRAAGTLEEVQASAGREVGYVIETRAAAEPALRAVRHVERVDAVTLADGWRRLTVRARAAAGDLREALASALAGAAVRELRREQASLEQIFVRMAADAETDFAARAAASQAAGST